MHPVQSGHSNGYCLPKILIVLRKHKIKKFDYMVWWQKNNYHKTLFDIKGLVLLMLCYFLLFMFQYLCCQPVKFLFIHRTGMGNHTPMQTFTISKMLYNLHVPIVSIYYKVEGWKVWKRDNYKATCIWDMDNKLSIFFIKIIYVEFTWWIWTSPYHEHQNSCSLSCSIFRL